LLMPLMRLFWILMSHELQTDWQAKLITMKFSSPKSTAIRVY
jgi:hypothetical protein